MERYLANKEVFPEDPQERFEKVFAALGNSEKKCLTMLCLSNRPLTASQLHRLFQEASNNVWQHHFENEASVCRQNLIPAGLAQETDGRFSITPAGKKFGQPIANFLLTKSADLPYSLQTVFGSTATGGGSLRPVISRLAILESLVNADVPMRATDFEALGIWDNSIARHLRNLQKLGYVDYISTNADMPATVTYQLRGGAQRDQVQRVNFLTYLTPRVADILFRDKKVNCQAVYEELRKDYPDTPKETTTRMIRRVLLGLEHQGICQRGLFRGGEIYSQAEVTDAGRRLYSEIVIPIKQALSGDDLLLYQWQETVACDIPALIEKYVQASGYANKRPVSEWINRAEKAIIEHPGITPRQLKALLVRNTYDLLKTLESQGKIVRQGRGLNLTFSHT